MLGEPQSFYRKHRYTTDNFIRFTQHLTEAFQLSEKVSTVWLNLKKRPNVCDVWLIHKLKSIDLNVWIIKWKNSFLSQRNTYVKITTTVGGQFCPKIGVPKESVIDLIILLT